MRRKRPNWARLLADSAELGFHAHCVVAMRLAKLTLGGAGAERERRLMVDEKIKAAAAANFEAARSVMSGKPHLAPERALGVYQRRVRKNLSRLGK